MMTDLSNDWQNWIYSVVRISNEPINISLVCTISSKFTRNRARLLLKISLLTKERRRDVKERGKKKKQKKENRKLTPSRIFPSGKKHRSIIHNHAWHIRYTRHLPGIENYLTTHQFPANHEPSDNWLVIPQAFIVSQNVERA